MAGGRGARTCVAEGVNLAAVHVAVVVQAVPELELVGATRLEAGTSNAPLATVVFWIAVLVEREVAAVLRQLALQHGLPSLPDLCVGLPEGLRVNAAALGVAAHQAEASRCACGLICIRESHELAVRLSCDERQRTAASLVEQSPRSSAVAIARRIRHSVSIRSVAALASRLVLYLLGTVALRHQTLALSLLLLGGVAA